jgi:ketosteroid isomerase-like protein
VNASSDSPQIRLLQRCFEALSHGEFAVLEEALDEDALWRSVYEGPTNCSGRRTIIEVMRRNSGGRLQGNIEETRQRGDRVLVAFRPERPADAADRPLDEGIAYMVVTFAAGRIAELKGCADRVEALHYLETGELPR